MAHPLKKEGVSGHNRKLQRYTRDYGAADPKMNKAGPDTKYKQEGPEDAVGFGADSAAPTARKDRPARKTTPANPVATYAFGGAVGGNMGLGAPKKGARTRKQPTTNVNIIVAPGAPAGGAGAPPPMAPPPSVGAPPAPPPGPPPGMPPMGEGKPPIPGSMPPPGAIPPGIMPPRAKGGRVHSDAAEDRVMIKSMVKPAALRADGGRVRKVGLTGGAASGIGRYEKNDTPLPRADGGAVTEGEVRKLRNVTGGALTESEARAMSGRRHGGRIGLTGGAESGVGRLEKARAQPKGKPQVI